MATVVINPHYIRDLVKDKEHFIEQKKRTDKFAYTRPVDVEACEVTEKSKVLYENDETRGILKRTIVANTYNWLDSHEDVHINGLFGKSIQENKKIPHTHDHNFTTLGRVGIPLAFYERPMKWRALGHAKNGETMVLMMETQIEKDLNPALYREYLLDRVDQHSVKMRYVKVDLAVNDENYKEEFKTWEEIYPSLGNKETADSLGYFWAVREARLLEVSAVILGSNELTPTLDNKSKPMHSNGAAMHSEGAALTLPEPTKVTPINVDELLKNYQNILQNG